MFDANTYNEAEHIFNPLGCLQILKAKFQTIILILFAKPKILSQGCKMISRGL